MSAIVTSYCQAGEPDYYGAVCACGAEVVGRTPEKAQARFVAHSGGCDWQAPTTPDGTVVPGTTPAGRALTPEEIAATLAEDNKGG